MVKSTASEGILVMARLARASPKLASSLRWRWLSGQTRPDGTGRGSLSALDYDVVLYTCLFERLLRSRGGLIIRVRCRTCAQQRMSYSPFPFQRVQHVEQKFDDHSLVPSFDSLVLRIGIRAYETAIARRVPAALLVLMLVGAKLAYA